jgi:hypothetical protein
MMTSPPLSTVTNNNLSSLYHLSLSLNALLTEISEILWLDLFTKPGIIMYYLLQLTQALDHSAFLSAKNVLVTRRPNVKAPNLFIDCCILT